MTDINQTHCDDHFAIGYIDLLCLYTWNSYNVVRQLHFNKTKKPKKTPIRKLDSFPQKECFPDSLHWL